MTRIRSAIAAALMVFGGATIAAAQQPTPPQHPVIRHALAQARLRMAKRLFKGVQLSDAERANLKAVRQKYAAQRKAIVAGNTIDKSQLRALRQSQQNDLRAALLPANQAKFDANIEAMRQRAAKRGKAIKP